MKVERAREAIDKGDISDAHEHLDLLLSIAPNNIEALKLKALLLNSEGKFSAEKDIWQKVHEVDNEDPDGISFLHRQQKEDRELFCFTDKLPAGRRFLAYPKSVAAATMLGFIGCMLFFFITHLGKTYPFLATKTAVITLFVVCVVLPWVLIIYRYLTGLMYVVITKQDIGFKSRLRYLNYHWKDISNVYIAYQHESNILKLIVLPKDKSAPVIKIDMTEGISPLCAKTYMIEEIKKCAGKVENKRYETLKLDREYIAF